MAEADRARANGAEAAKTVYDHLKEVGWEPQETEEEAVWHIDFTEDKTPVSHALATVRIDLERFMFVIAFRDRAPIERRAEVMEFITRANYDMVVGNFELDLDGGSIRFKSSLDFTRVVLSLQLVRNVIVCAMDVVECYADALVAVVRGDKRAREAIEETESGIAEAESDDEQRRR